MAEDRFYPSWEHPERARLDLSGKRWLQQHFRPWRMPDAGANAGETGSLNPQQRSGDERMVYTADHPESGWLPTRMPNDVRTALFEDGRLPHPYLDRNSDVWNWVYEQDWWLRCKFHIPPTMARSGRRIQLCVSGVSSPASFWLNCEHAGDARETAARHRFELSGPFETESEYLLTLCLHPERHRQTYGRAPMFTANPGAWDGSWPGIAPIGLWGAIWLETLPAVRIRDVDMNVSIDPASNQGVVVARMQLEADVPIRENMRVRFHIRDEETGKTVVRLEGFAPWTTPSKPVRLTWSNPKIWWPRGMGRQPLYRLECEVTAAGHRDVWSSWFGLRRVDARIVDGMPRVHVNGHRAPLRGVYWLPLDLMHGRPAPNDYERALTAAADAGFNLVRIWSGAPAEPQHFYGICDRLGLMVWQEFPADARNGGTEKASEKNVAAVCQDIARRLRYHPSLALWSTGDGRIPRFEGDANAAPAGFLEAPGNETPPSPEPTAALVTVSNTASKAIAAVPHENCFVDVSGTGLSVPAIGCEGPPRINTLDEFISEAEQWPPGPALEHHAISPARYEGAGETAASLKDQLWAGALQQAVRCQALVERERLRAGETPGFTLWRLSEPWPAGSFGLLGPGGTPKPAYYWVKRVLKPYAVLIQDDGPFPASKKVAAALHIQNHTQSKLPHLKAEIRWISTKGIQHFEMRLTDVLDPYQTAAICEAETEMPKNGFVLLHVRLFYKDRLLTEVAHPYTRGDWNTIARAMRPVTADPPETDSSCSIKAVGRPLLCVEIPGDITAPYSDNFFTLIPDEERAVRIRPKRGRALAAPPRSNASRALPPKNS